MSSSISAVGLSRKRGQQQLRVHLTENGLVPQKRGKFLPNGVQSPAPITNSQQPSGCLTPTVTSVPSAQSQKPPLSSQKQHYFPSLLPPSTEPSNLIGNYQLIRKVPDRKDYLYVKNIATGESKLAQPLSSCQYSHLLTVTARLNEHEKYYFGADGHLLKQQILSEKIEIVEDSKCRKYLIQPLDHGSLHSQIQSNAERQKTDFPQILCFFTQIVQMVAFCHSLGIVMRDLKLRKFVFSDQKRSILGLCNVEDCLVLDDVNQDKLSERHGCPAYVSPEILDLSASSFSGYRSDMWSLGVLLYVLVTGRYPFFDSSASRLFDKIRQCSFSLPVLDSSVSKTLKLELRILLSSLLRTNPLKRPSANDLLESSAWLQSGCEALALRRRLDNLKMQGSVEMGVGGDRVQAEWDNEEEDQMVPNC